MKFAGGIVLGLIIASVFFISRPAPIPETTQKEFKALTVNEAKTFAEAKTPEDKLKAAEALYGKMMVLFLANLGIELQKSTPAELPAGTETETRPEEKAPLVADSAPAALTEITKTECAPCAASEKKKEDARKLTTPEKFSSSTYINSMQPIVRQMNGVFSGKLSYFAGEKKGKIDLALLEVNLRQRDEVLDGSIAVILTDSDTNVPYSRNRGNGGNKTIRYNSADRVVYVEASPNSFFSFRAAEFRRSEVRGEYYEKNALVGRAVLFRQ